MLMGDVRSMEDMFSTLIMFSKGEYRIDKRDTDMYKEVIIPSLNKVFGALKSNGVIIDYDSSFKEEEAYAYTDPRISRHIFTNLFSNTAKYTPRGGRVSWGKRDKGIEDWYNVFNTGVSIPKEYIYSIFDPFVRASPAEESGERGYGIGLAFCSDLAKALGERIFAEENIEDGVSIVVTSRHK
jgi:signal transduction histidine kinase